MKILQIASGDFFSTYGGGQVYVKNIVDELIRQQCDIAVVSFVNTCFAIKKGKYHEAELYEVGANGLSELQSLISSIHPDIIHAHSHKAIAVQVGYALHIPVIITAHHGGILCPAGTLLNGKDMICRTTVSHQDCLACCLKNIRSGVYWYPFMKYLPQKIYLKLGRFLQKKPFVPFITPIGQSALQIVNKQKEWHTIAEGCTCMIAPSHAIKDAMVRNGLSVEKVTVIPHGIPLPQQEFTYSTVDKDNRIKFFYVGRICHVKGIYILLQAFDQLSNKQVELHLIGGPGNKAESRYMKRLQRQYHSNTQIVWHGKVRSDEVYAMIQNYHVLIHAAIYLEAFGLNIAEALAMGKPVLATRCGGAEMQVEDGVNGWLVEPNNSGALKLKIEKVINEFLFNQPFLLRKVVSIEEHCKTLVKLYGEVAD